MTFQVLALKRLTPPAGNLRATASVLVGAVKVHDVRIVRQGLHKPYVQPPQRTWTDASGKVCYGGPIIEFPADVWSAIQRAVLLRYAEETGEFWN